MNKHRDEANLQALENMGWEALVIWECQTRNNEDTSKVIRKFLS